MKALQMVHIFFKKRKETVQGNVRLEVLTSKCSISLYRIALG